MKINVKTTIASAIIAGLFCEVGLYLLDIGASNWVFLLFSGVPIFIFCYLLFFQSGITTWVRAGLLLLFVVLMIASVFGFDRLRNYYFPSYSISCDDPGINC